MATNLTSFKRRLDSFLESRSNSYLCTLMTWRIYSHKKWWLLYDRELNNFSQRADCQWFCTMMVRWNFHVQRQCNCRTSVFQGRKQLQGYSVDISRTYDFLVWEIGCWTNWSIGCFSRALFVMLLLAYLNRHSWPVAPGLPCATPKEVKIGTRKCPFLHQSFPQGCFLPLQQLSAIRLDVSVGDGASYG